MKTALAVRPVCPRAERQLVAAGIPPLLARLYAARNVETADELDNRLGRLLPYQGLKNINAAARRLAQAVRRRESILIIADYDADGATACAVGMVGLRQMGAVVDFFVPNRFTHGYGLTPELADIARRRGADLIMTVDNGIASIDGVARAKALGMDVLVTDHHLAGDSLPDCIIVNPNQPGCGFAGKSLAGVGVVFYVLTALRALLREEGFFAQTAIAEPNLAELLDLVAVGTVADVVALERNNRILVGQGLRRIRAGKTRPGIRALFQVARRDAAKAQPFDLGFAIGPRLNAAGRLDDMSVGINCLLAEDETEAQLLAERLNSLNRERREIEQSMSEEAQAAAETVLAAGQNALTFFREDWHQGVVGIVAGRLKDRFHRPCIVFASADNGELRGSGRSIPGLHLRDALDLLSKRHSDLILRFGGHAMAAGLSIRQAEFPRFQAAFETLMDEMLDTDTLTKTYHTDGALPAGELTLDLAEMLENGVWGQGFPAPLFADECDVLWQRPVGSGHTKAGLSHHGTEVEAMFFRFDGTLPARVCIVYRPVANEWRGRQELQLHVDYWEEV